MATDPVQIVRRLIPDTEEVFDGETLFTDEDIQIYLEIGVSPYRAAGLAMIAIANSEAIISKIIRTQDLQTDGAKLSEAILKNAQLMFARADKEDELANGFYMNIVDYNGYTADRPELTEFWNGVDGQISPPIVPGTSFDGGTG